jgi:antitoxin (DNA-binding transcriptional repressor) of toxin-antitoxin stability system
VRHRWPLSSPDPLTSRLVMASVRRYHETRDGAVKTVKIAELENRLSHYLRLVKRGESILVCERDRVIARIDRVSTHESLPETDATWLDRLERRGIIRYQVG